MFLGTAFLSQRFFYFWVSLYPANFFHMDCLEVSFKNDVYYKLKQRISILGIFSNFISVQLKFIATERFDMDLKTFEGNVQVARALNLLLMPHFMLLLTSYYDMYQVKLIFAAFLLNIIPAALIINPCRIEQTQPEIARYQTLPA